jgi:hypothetical protein
MNHIKYLKSLGACDPAIEFASDYPDLPSAYAACARPDWLFWLAVRTGVTRQPLVLAACACARTALPYAERRERAVCAIETAEAWCRGEATIEQVCATAVRATAVHPPTAADYADAAAANAAATAYTAYVVRATAACAAACAAADAAAADADAARVTMCDLIRAIIPCPS